MVIGIIGESCSGKSSLAEAMRVELGAEVITGTEYLRMAGSGEEAASLFRRKLEQALHSGLVVYVISEKEELELLPEGALRILVKADLATIKARYRSRMHGKVPFRVERMIEKRHGMFDGGTYDYVFNGGTGHTLSLCDAIRDKLRLSGEKR